MHSTIYKAALVFMNRGFVKPEEIETFKLVQSELVKAFNAATEAETPVEENTDDDGVPTEE